MIRRSSIRSERKGEVEIGLGQPVQHVRVQQPPVISRKSSGSGARANRQHAFCSERLNGLAHDDDVLDTELPRQHKLGRHPYARGELTTGYLWPNPIHHLAVEVLALNAIHCRLIV